MLFQLFSSCLIMRGLRLAALGCGALGSRVGRLLGEFACADGVLGHDPVDHRSRAADHLGNVSMRAAATYQLNNLVAENGRTEARSSNKVR